MPASAADVEAVTRLLGRRPQGDFEVVVRDHAGEPVVIANAPFLDDGTPMPTRFWLVGRATHYAVSQLEAAGGVDEVERELGLDTIADAHRRYAEDRFGDGGIPEGRPVPTGGVGGTRVGVKCLHAHYAWFLAGGDDPVGRWVHQRLQEEQR